MQPKDIQSLFLKYKETSLSHRYITNKHIEPLLENLSKSVIVKTIGKSVLKKPIYGLEIGHGKKRVLMWSQMHGNESTTTKAIFDLLNTILEEKSSLNYILETCTLYIIPILNPDGAAVYTRINANEVDLNRDAQELTQPESKILKNIFEIFKPHFCYNLHGQRTIFSAGKTNMPATISFLAPAQDQNCIVTANRKVAMEVISVMNESLQNIIPNQVGVYDDAFNINCVGDTFQSKNVPTILFEAGYYKEDYARDKTRELIYISYIVSLDYISKENAFGSDYQAYFNIPENKKLFFDIIFRNVIGYSDEGLVDIAILYKEKLINNRVEFIPIIEKIEKLNDFHGHIEIDAKQDIVLGINNDLLKVNNENVFVILNNEKISLLPK